METAKKRIVESTKQIWRLYYKRVNVEEAVKSMRGQNISAELVKSIYNQLSADAENLMEDRFYHYTIECSNYHQINYWTSRYLLIYKSEEYQSASHEINIFDLFNNTSITVTVEKSADMLLEIYSLKDDFGLLRERGNTDSFLSLIFLDLDRHSLKKLQTIIYLGDINIVVNEADPTTFILEYFIDVEEMASQVCKIAEKTIIVGDSVDIEFSPQAFYDKWIYGADWTNENHDFLDMSKLYSYNMDEKKINQFDLEASMGYKINEYNCPKWVRDSVFFRLERENNSDVIGYYNFQTREWNVLDFYLKLSNYYISGFEKGNLIIRTSEPEPSFYKIPFGHPESLENVTWFSLIKMMRKHKTVKNPYETARKYLPPNSTINCPFEKSDKNDSKNKRRKLK